jgi:hypothetical protein
MVWLRRDGLLFLPLSAAIRNMPGVSRNLLEFLDLLDLLPEVKIDPNFLGLW